MMNENHIGIITQYVDGNYFDRDKLISYLNLHTVVGNEVFSYCDKHVGQKKETTYPNCLDDHYGYMPVDVDCFIRRIPFYFYVKDRNTKHVGDLQSLVAGFFIDDTTFEENCDSILEQLYTILEHLFYDKKISLSNIFNYIIEQTHQVGKTHMFFQWAHYIDLCDELSRTDYMPDCFITNYNEVLESKGLSPIIYEISFVGNNEVFWRYGKTIEFEGVFPIDCDGNPIMKWIGLQVKNANNITCKQDKSSRGRSFVEITPNTTIHALNCYNSDNDDENYWYQLYAGPLTMEFNHKVLKDRRLRLQYRQKEVADAVGATVRTYQKWESGNTTPDGHYLLRLLNWLDISDIQDIVCYTEDM